MHLPLLQPPSRTGGAAAVAVQRSPLLPSHSGSTRLPLARLTDGPLKGFSQHLLLICRKLNAKSAHGLARCCAECPLSGRLPRSAPSIHGCHKSHYTAVTSTAAYLGTIVTYGKPRHQS